MRSVAEEIRGAAAAGEQKRNRREVSFRRVADFAREHEVVAPIVCCLAAAWGDVIEGHRRFGEALAAVCADGAVLLEKPSPRFRVGDAPRGMRGELRGPVRDASFGALLSSSGSAPAPGARRTGDMSVLLLEQLVVGPVMGT
jgi:hypothetical protein